MILLKNGTVYTMDEAGVFVGDVKFDQGKIVAVGKDLSTDGCEVIDCTGKNIYPGFIDGHSHLGMQESSIRFEGDDVNEMSDPLTPHVRAIDALNPMDETIHNAACGGVTTVCSGPGSANVIGGTFAIWKTNGHVIDKMVINPMAAMKCAFGENPKRVYSDNKIKTRMQTAAYLRETLMKTKEYMAKKALAGDDISKQPAYDMKLEAMIPVLEKKIPLKTHAHRADDILTALRIAREFDVLMTLDHCTEGHLIVDEVKASGFPAFVGPSLTDKSKFELKNLTFATAGILNKAGVKIALITDAPVIPQEYLPLCAGLACKKGLAEMEALKAITINPAEILGIADRVGSLTAGKDADIVVSDGNIFNTLTNVNYTFINGEKVYQF
ncbi:imidazolonepropionase-like amidohydrolase [Dielma fastidiosa]|uniref:Imidazolonepropionase-like amidohydrolase n=1 Tax=Dielma fastidiosa TaxID=1034346 RepID=A0A318KHE5_9FIRM|nr:imidazolonepropionase-like amidohydrolase [Dielma fastidiosa]